MALSPDLAQWLRAEGHDAVHASDLAMNCSPDSEILQFAARTGRIVITADLDFLILLRGETTAKPRVGIVCGAS